ncbi:MAG TPA: FixH family protein [Lautropia sp.]|nr:FixH family protein [Lautropia sp.]
MTAATAPLPSPAPEAAIVADGVTLGPAHRHPGREPLVWLVAGIPLLTIVAGMVTLWIAFQRADSNVTDEYYKDGLAINRRIERDEQAATFGLKGRLSAAATVTAGGNSRRAGSTIAPAVGGTTLAISLDLSGMPEAFEPQLTLRMTHPVQQSLDRRVVLEGVGAGRYVGRIQDDGAPGTRWTLAVESPRWRLPFPGLHRLESGTHLGVDALTSATKR